MSAERPLLTAGLTGGIGSGKSTIDSMFERLGASVIEADRIVHRLLGPGGRLAGHVLGAFGPALAQPDGGVNREALGAIVFADAEARARLERLVHPEVSREISTRIEAIRDEGGGPIVIVDAALLVETGAHRQFDRLIVVTCSEQRQIERLAASRGLTSEEALRRIRAQASSADKAAKADYIIDNEGPIAATQAQVGRVYRCLLEDHARKRSAGKLN